jgi:TonB-linked SusC/RagA family outer membrane protein
MKKSLFEKIFLFFMLLVSSYAFGQGTVKGVVKGGDGSPIIGASVVILGSDLGSITDENGAFEIGGVPSGEQTVETSFIGLQTSQRKVQVVNGETTELDFDLTSSDVSLNEVVVIGYGSTLKKDLTGSVASVNSREFNKGVITSPDQLIAGKLAGVQVQGNSGRPGAGSTIRIRGGASLNASNDPLIVIDGVPVDNDGLSGVSNPLALINPNDIESFSVLKDASAAAIYGARASNGVIIITTKKGSGKTKFNFSTNLGISKIARKMDVLTADEFRTFVKEKEDPNNPYSQLLTEGSGTDWQDQIFQTAFASDNNFSVSGTALSMPYRLSLGYLNQSGILKTDKLNRLSAGINLNPKFLEDNLIFDFNVKYSTSKSNFANQDAIGAATNFDPTKPVNSTNNRFGGYWEWLNPQSVSGLKALAPRNPVGLLNQKEDIGYATRVLGNVSAEYKLPFVKGLSAKVNFGLDNANGYGYVTISDSAASNYQRYKDAAGKLHGGIKNQYAQDKLNWLVDYTVKYEKAINDQFRFDVLGGYSFQDFKIKNYFYDDNTFDGTVANKRTFEFDEPQNTLISYFGRANFVYSERYLLTATLRRDGSSRFSEDNRWGWFPSVAFAWKIKEEGFLKNSNAFSDLKLRLGWGTTGQQDGIGNYTYLPNYSLGNSTAQYQFGSNFFQVYRPAGYNPNLKWEQTSTANLGIDFGILDNKITGSLDFYNRKTKDLINVISQSAGINFSNKITANVGNMENTGVELNLNTQPITNSQLTWNLGFNFTYNKNKITNLTAVEDLSYPGNQFGGISGGTGYTALINSVNYPRGTFYVYQQVYNTDGTPVDNVFVDQNGDNSVTDKDLTRFKSVDPNYLIGLTTSVLLNNRLSIGTTLRGSIGNYMYNNVNSNTGTRRNILNPLGTLSNGSADVLKSNMSGDGQQFYLSNYFVENASFLKMDNVYVGYNFGNLFSQKTNFSASFTVQNVFTVTEYKGIDPEISGGIDNNFYPRARTFMLGLSLDF